MVVFTAPKIYENRVGAIQDIGKYARELGQKVLVIGGEIALEKTEVIISKSLTKSALMATIETFTGFPTLVKAQSYARKIKSEHYDVVIGVGGGRAIDQAKAASELAQVALITVPTIAATCAAWAAVAILYDDVGSFTQPLFHQVGPRVILVDTEIVLSAPERFVYAGVIDTLAKRYEISPYLGLDKGNMTFQVMVDLSERAFDTLLNYTKSALAEAREGSYTESGKLVLDAIIYLAGLTGSFQTGRLYQGLGHPFYNAATYFPSTHKFLHGELVGFGLLLQDEVQGQLTEDKLALFCQFNNLWSLSDLGLNDKQQVAALAKTVIDKFGSIYEALPLTQDAESLAQAMFTTNEKIEKTLRFKV